MSEATPDATTFEAFAAREFDHVLALALASLRDEHDALDVAQETMTRCFDAWDEVSVLDRPGAWSRRVALNLVTDRDPGRLRRTSRPCGTSSCGTRSPNSPVGDATRSCCATSWTSRSTRSRRSSRRPSAR